MAVPYDSKAVANYYLLKPEPERGGANTQMKLHKLIFYAHGWHLGLRGEPLLDEMVEAWEYGPVVPSLYHEFKDLGAAPIDRLATEFDVRTAGFDRIPAIDDNDQATSALLDRVWKIYGPLTASQLSQMTHEPGSPWSETRRKNPKIKSVDIPNDLIEEYFRLKASQNQNGS